MPEPSRRLITHSCILLGGILISGLWFDWPLAMWVHSQDFHQAAQLARKVARFGYALYTLLPLTMALILSHYTKKTSLFRFSLYMWLAIVLSGLSCDLLKVLIGRARPSLGLSPEVIGFYGFSIHSRYWSFPSGHTTTIAAIATCLGRYDYRWGTVGSIMLLFVGGSRIVSQHHFLSDVLAGVLIGWLSARLLEMVLSKKYPV